MVRDAEDKWGIEESVGATALGTAAIRAYETTVDAPLFTDPYAQYFVDAAEEKGYTGWGLKPEEFANVGPDLAEFMRTLTNFAASRTKHFDDFFTAASDSGVRQFVIVAAGLDTRAWRLPELVGHTVYEIDQPGVLDFKAEALRTPGVTPVANYVPVPIDLRQDWPLALRKAGFQDSEPTGWSIEGLLPYLPPAAQAGLFEQISTLSAPGSRIVVDAYPPESLDQAALRASFDQIDSAVRTAPTRNDDDRIYSDELIFTGDRTDVADWLTAHGWTATSVRCVDVMARYERPASPNVELFTLSGDFVGAHLPAG